MQNFSAYGIIFYVSSFSKATVCCFKDIFFTCQP